jgi:hypothetical protein
MKFRFGFPIIVQAMTCRHFKKLTETIHINKNENNFLKGDNNSWQNSPSLTLYLWTCLWDIFSSHLTFGRQSLKGWHCYYVLPQQLGYCRTWIKEVLATQTSLLSVLYI